MAIKLVDIKVKEISLAAAAANRKRFIIKKEGIKMEEELKKELEELFEEDEIEVINEEIEILKGDDVKKKEKLSEEALKAVKSAASLLNKHKEDLTDELLTVLKALVKYASYGYPEKAAVTKEEITIDDLIDVEKSGARFSKATIEQINKAIEMLKGLLSAREDELKKAGLDKLPIEVVAKLERLKLMEEEEKRRIEVEKQAKDQALLETVNVLKAEVENLKKTKGVKKSIDGQDTDDADDEDGEEDKWPSIPFLKP